MKSYLHSFSDAASNLSYELVFVIVAGKIKVKAISIAVPRLTISDDANVCWNIEHFSFSNDSIIQMWIE